MWFFYDQQGNRVGMADSSNHIYYYLYNLQGDVIALADAETGKLAATYTYDVWGKCVSVKNASGYTIGTSNPFRYRGYYYDTETGFYYLNSRYYNPEIGRFLNADAFASTDITDVLSANMFVYCENNPVNMVDPNGCDPIPSWATRIIDGNATEADYKKALSVNPEGWGGHVRYYVDKAVGLAREHYINEGKSGVTGYGGGVTGGWCFMGEVSVYYIEDQLGNEALLVTVGGGGGLGASLNGSVGKPGAIGSAIYFPDAVVVWDLAGMGASIGGTAGVVSGEMLTSPSSGNGVSFGASVGCEFHAIITYSWIVPLN